MCEHAGMEKLRAYMKRVGIKPSEMAEAVGTSRGYMHDILTNRRRPGLNVAVAIERATNGAVPAAEWAAAQSQGDAA